MGLQNQDESHRVMSSPAAKLYDAALKGDVPSLHVLLREDNDILNRYLIEKIDHFKKPLLHVAVGLGHLEFITEILQQNPKLATELDPMTKSTALHLAVEEGHLDIVKILVEINPHMCCAYDQFGRIPLHVAANRGQVEVLSVLVDANPHMCCVYDQFGRNPLHVAAIRGHVEVLSVLVEANPQACRQRTTIGHQTVLHLCAIYKQPDALGVLMSYIDGSDLLNLKDADGNTVLHLAVIANNLEMVQLIVRDKNVKQNVMNEDGLTAIDIYHQKRKDLKDNNKILQALKQAKVRKAAFLSKRDEKRIAEKGNALMVVASLIAAMAFQVGVNPPGGVWQDTKNDPIDNNITDTIYATENKRTAGESILAYHYPGAYYRLVVSNMIGFVSSIIVILLLISGLPLKRGIAKLLMFTMWVALSATIFTYLLSVSLVAKDSVETADEAVYAWVAIMLGLFLVHIARFLIKAVKKLMKILRKWGVKSYQKAKTRMSA